MKKLSNITESIWSDIQKRSAGDVVRKEDEFTEKDRKDLDKLIMSYANEVVYGRGMNTDACNLDDFCDYIETDNEIKDLNKDKILQYVKDYWADEVCDDVDGTIEQVQLEYHQDITESIWSDIQKRSTGETIRKEDEITQVEMDAIVDSMNEFATRVVWDNEKFSLEKFCKCIREHLKFNKEINIENIIKYVNLHWIEDIESDIEGFIKEEEREKERGMNESIWSDIQKRSSGETIRKEDDVDLMGMNEFIDYLNNHYNCTVSPEESFVEKQVLYTFILEIGLEQYALCLDFKTNIIFVSSKLFPKLPQLFNKMSQKFDIAEDIHNDRRTNIYPKEKTDTINNSFYLSILNFIIENLSDKKQLLITKK